MWIRISSHSDVTKRSALAFLFRRLLVSFAMRGRLMACTDMVPVPTSATFRIVSELPQDMDFRVVTTSSII